MAAVTLDILIKQGDKLVPSLTLPPVKVPKNLSSTLLGKSTFNIKYVDTISEISRYIA